MYVNGKNILDVIFNIVNMLKLFNPTLFRGNKFWKYATALNMIAHTRTRTFYRKSFDEISKLGIHNLSQRRRYITFFLT